MHDDNSRTSPYPASLDPDGTWPLNPHELDMIARSNELAAIDLSLPEVQVWPRFRDHDHLHLTGRCPGCGIPRGFGLSGRPWRYLSCPECGGLDVRLTIQLAPLPEDIEYACNHEPEDVAMMAKVFERPGYFTQVTDIGDARKSVRKGRRMSRDVFRTAWEAIARTGILDERHAIMIESGAHAGDAMRSLVAAFIRKRQGRTMRDRFREALKEARNLTVRGESA